MSSCYFHILLFVTFFMNNHKADVSSVLVKLRKLIKVMYIYARDNQCLISNHDSFTNFTFLGLICLVWLCNTYWINIIYLHECIHRPCISMDTFIGSYKEKDLVNLLSFLCVQNLTHFQRENHIWEGIIRQIRCCAFIIILIVDIHIEVVKLNRTFLKCYLWKQSNYFRNSVKYLQYVCEIKYTMEMSLLQRSW
jgi:hypothetical protein